MKKTITFLLIGIFLMSMVFAAQNQAGLGTGKAQEGSFTTVGGEELQIQLQDNNQVRLRTRDIEAHTDLDVLQEQIREQNQERTKLNVMLSNGKNAEIKVMPDAASETALQRLRLHVCSEENNCQIELKEVGKGEDMQLAYEIQIERHSRILGIFQKKMQVRAQVDAENRELIRVNKPWWAFLATEPEEETTAE